MITFLPTEYRVEGWPETERRRVILSRRDDEADIWAIVDSCFVLAKDGQWEYEPRPSSRTEEFLKRTRYTFIEAMQHIEKHVEEILVQSQSEMPKMS